MKKISQKTARKLYIACEASLGFLRSDYPGGEIWRYNLKNQKLVELMDHLLLEVKRELELRVGEYVDNET